MNISFVIPCYRSEHTLEKVVAEIKTKMAEMGESSYEIILVNDCSPDGTYGIRKQFGLVGFAAALIVLFFEYFGENKKHVI